MTEQYFVMKHGLQFGTPSCENELEELMHQIDILVNNKKVEWEKQVMVLEQKLQAKDHEMAKAMTALDQKKCEVGTLCRKLEEVEKAQGEMVQNYENQLQALKYQLYKLKKNYEKLNYNHMKNPRQGFSEACTENSQSYSVVAQLTEKLEEYKAKSNEWERQRMIYQNHLKSLTEHKESLKQKCDVFQKQSQSYQEQLSSRTQLQDEAISSNQTEIRRLKYQLDTSQEKSTNDRVIIENLKSTVKEITLSRNLLKDENQRLLQELKKCQKHCQKMEIQISEAKIELQARDDLLRAVELDQREKETSEMKKYKNLKENELSKQELNSHNCNILSEEQANEILRCYVPSQAQIPNMKMEVLQIENENLTALLENLETCRIMALKSLKEQERYYPSDVNLKSRNEKLYTDNAQLPIRLVIQENTCKKMDNGLWISDNGTQNNGQKDRSSNEESNEKTQAQATDYIRNTTKAHSNCDLEAYSSGWDTPCDSFLIDLDGLETYSVIMKGEDPVQENEKTLQDSKLSDVSSIFICDQQRDSITLPSNETSFVSAAEKFLHEENERAKDFEKLLNSHIEKLQRCSENTLIKYRIQNQNQHT